ncbi:hypothetical protein BXZ70DRAFT_897262 [Cristinia sonorae]|uniref:RhoGAP-domain-containing protein n=1 Tax=Cristinia sonorae TaxID=1940300 RepID=A0A8K0UKY3_9AGAR|nr:hypothetical protein BXZ70DRAFT_897262 [Cristinia sonorae]
MNLNIPQVTPVRDNRVQPLRFDASSSQHSSPTTSRTAPNSAAPPASSSAAPSTIPLTIDSVISQHASSSNPPMAALDTVVTDRNTLAAQNTQLWKLIEKQKSGYSHLIKELERVRGERDVFRSKLQAYGENTDSLLKAHREKERREGKETLRATASHTHLRASESNNSNGSAGADIRANLMRAQSDENAVRPGPRTSSRDINMQQTSTTGGRERQNSQTSLQANQSSSSVYLSTSHTASSSNLSNASPTASITQSASSSTASLAERQPIETPRKPSPLQLTTRADSLPSAAAAINTPARSSTSPSGQSPASTRSVDDSSRNGLHSSRSPGTQTPRATQQPNVILLTPATPAPTSTPQRAAPEHRKATLESPVVESSNLSRPQAQSRESRISLPEEAKRYYASMGESPLPSPHLVQAPSGGFPPKSNGTSQLSDSPPPLNGAAETSLAYAKSTESGEFLDMEEDGDSTYASTVGDEPSANNGEVGDYEEEDSVKRPEGKLAAVEDFPLPPSSPPQPGGDVLRMRADDAQSQYSGTTLITSDSATLSDERTPHGHIPPSPQPLARSDTKFRALPLLASDLARTQITVSHSSIRANDRGKEVLSFVIIVQPAGKDAWRVEKLYSDVVTLDGRVRQTLGKSLLKKLMNLPEGRLWKDHAPAKADQRKDALEAYLRSMIALPAKNRDEIVAFFTSDIVREAQKPVSQAGYKEGYLTKRGKNFGGWKTRYFVLQGPSLEYYESRGGTHLGSIVITGAQIGRQQRAQDKQQSDEDNEYRHAFLIIEARKGPGGSNPRHVLCAQSDRERDDWVEELVRYVSGTYNDEDGAVQDEAPSPAQPLVGRSSTSLDQPQPQPVTPVRRPPRKDDTIKGHSAQPPDASNPNLVQNAPPPSDESSMYSHSPVKASTPQSYVEQRPVAVETPLSTSLPSASPLAGTVEDVDIYAAFTQRATSEMGHYPDLVDQRAEFSKGKQGRVSPDQPRRRDKRRSLNPLRSAPIPERDPSPEKDADPHTPRVDAHGKVKISGPMNGTPIPAGYKFGGKDAPAESTSTNDRREKAKSRTFWGFGRHDKASLPAHAPRAVFGVSLEESLEVAQIASLPAIVFRCIQYLEEKKADQEEGIYRLSGSSAVIKALKDRFNMEGDVDLLASDEYWDPHAIAGLLKTFLRELPASILTRDLHLRFLSVIDFVDPQERITELSHLIASLPVANYSLLRALTAHLILIVQNANVNKMTMRNVGIVFSPTLGIPAGVFSLMLGEFKRVFNVDGTWTDEETGGTEVERDAAAELSRRNSRHYSDAAADKLLGLSGRALHASSEDGQSDEGEDISIPEDSGTEETTEQDSVADSPDMSSPSFLVSDHTHSNSSSRPHSHASSVAASRGLNINVAADKASRRQSRMVGLPHSPRPPRDGGANVSPLAPATPRGGSAPHSPVPLPHTPK